VLYQFSIAFHLAILGLNTWSSTPTNTTRTSRLLQLWYLSLCSAFAERVSQDPCERGERGLARRWKMDYVYSGHNAARYSDAVHAEVCRCSRMYTVVSATSVRRTRSYAGEITATSGEYNCYLTRSSCTVVSASFVYDKHARTSEIPYPTDIAMYEGQPKCLRFSATDA